VLSLTGVVVGVLLAASALMFNARAQAAPPMPSLDDLPSVISSEVSQQFDANYQGEVQGGYAVLLGGAAAIVLVWAAALGLGGSKSADRDQIRTAGVTGFGLVALAVLLLYYGEHYLSPRDPFNMFTSQERWYWGALASGALGFMFMVVAALKERRATQLQTKRPCPHCLTWIDKRASVCSACGRGVIEPAAGHLGHGR
jgi:hypothetical protein